MKAEDLQIGDWVLYDGKPNQVRSLTDDNGCRLSMRLHSVLVYDAKPIPLTHDILEKNGFANYDVGHKVKGWTIMDEEYCSDIPFTLTDNDFDTQQGDYKWGPVEDDREESFVREVGRIKYVHELQHILKVCGANKEIVL